MSRATFLIGLLAAAGAGLLLAARQAGAATLEDGVERPPVAGWLERALDALPQPGGNMHSNVRAFLDMLSVAEGTTRHGYRTLFGGKEFTDLTTHPNVRTYGEWLEPGKTTFTTAAGRYQETFTTWRRLSDKLGTEGFSAEVQDAHAIELINEAGALDDVQAGRFEAAVAKLGRVWASLPSANVPQKRHSLEYIAQAYTDAGGEIAAA